MKVRAEYIRRNIKPKLDAVEVSYLRNVCGKTRNNQFKDE